MEQVEAEKEKKDFVTSQVELASLSSSKDTDAYARNVKIAFGADPDSNEQDINSEFLYEKFKDLSYSEAIDILKEAVKYHDDDVNFPQNVMTKIELIIEGPAAFGTDEETLALEARKEATLIHFHSPYPEVRAVTDPFDDPNTPAGTFRAYFWGIFWTIIGTGLNQFFSPRQPSIYLTADILQIFLLPCGRISEYLPDWGFTFKGKRHSLNPGPWTYKEQMLATVIVNVSIGGAFASLNNIFVDKLPMYYNSPWANYGYQFLLIFSTQFVGFGFAGIMRKLIVYPVRAVWPILLPTLALNKALVSKETNRATNGWTLTRYRFFLWVFSLSFAYFWIPSYLMQATSFFNWLTWISPKNLNLAVITGSVGGLGINPVPTFDWTVINFNGPLVIPFYSQLNQYIGSLIAGVILIPAVFYSNYKWTSYFPVNSNQIFTNTGEQYNVSKILTGGLLDKSKYQEYGPPFYTAANLVVYGANFALYPFAIIYSFVTEWSAISSSAKELWNTIRHPKRSNFETQNDVHCQMMSKYEEVPDWWFTITLVIAVALGVIMVKVYPDTHTPVWGIFFTVGINFVFLIPITLILSVTGFTFGLNVLVELIVGYAIPGNGTALNILKCYGYNIDGQAQGYISDQKMAHYAKVPPKSIFKGQMLSTVVQCLVSVGLVNWQINNIEGLCTMHQAQKFTCPGTNTFFSASVLWGVIGPQKVFTGMYPILQWCFLIGTLATIPCLLARKFFPKQTRYFHPTLIIGGMLVFAPYNLTYLTMGMYVAFFFMYFVRHRYQPWWERYNYVLSASLTAGCAFSAVVIFFAVQFRPKDLKWWGNLVSYAGIDNDITGRLSIPSNPGYVGPSPENYP